MKPLETDSQDERLMDLLAGDATEGLCPRERMELRALLSGNLAWPDPDVLQRAAAAVDIALLPEPKLADLNPELDQRLRAMARDFVSAGTGSPRGEGGDEQGPTPSNSSLFISLGWWMAAAAVVVAAIGFWPPTEVAENELSPRQALSNLEASADTVSADWQWSEAVDDYNSVQGRVVWDEASQSGFMVFKGLPRLDPKEAQYQLWIVDGRKRQDGSAHHTNPVDGGVFDLPAEGEELVVPFSSRLPVEDAALFVLTREQPGGVVVSKGPFLVQAGP